MTNNIYTKKDILDFQLKEAKKDARITWRWFKDHNKPESAKVVKTIEIALDNAIKYIK